jgi:hypothetical protein
MHGKTSVIGHDGRGVFHALNNPLTVTRYHSLLVEEATLPAEFEISAWTLPTDGSSREILGLRHRTLPLEGVQFHPESILSEQGLELLAICLMSLGHKIISFTLEQGALDFASIKTILTDGLFTLIVIAIVKTLFIKSGFDYALTFLEIAFVVIIRKLILLESTPSETDLLIALGVTSSIFFVLII